MKRSQAFLLSAFLTLLVTGAVFTFSGGVRARSDQAQPALQGVEPAPLDLAASFQTQERVLQTTIGELQSTLAAMDTDFAGQIQAVQETLAAGQQAGAAQETSIAGLQEELKAQQAALTQDAQSHEQQIVALQANEAQLRQNLETTLVALQTAYRDLAVQQAAQAAAAGGGDNGGSAYSEHEDDDHGEHEHAEHEHEGHDDDD